MDTYLQIIYLNKYNLTITQAFPIWVPVCLSECATSSDCRPCVRQFVFVHRSLYCCDFLSIFYIWSNCLFMQMYLSPSDCRPCGSRLFSLLQAKKLKHIFCILYMYSLQLFHCKCRFLLSNFRHKKLKPKPSIIVTWEPDSSTSQKVQQYILPYIFSFHVEYGIYVAKY